MFGNRNYDLDVAPTDGLSKEAVDEILLSNQYPGITCLVCGGTAKYRLIPLHKRVATAEIQDKGFVCAHCINMRRINLNDYKITDM